MFEKSIESTRSQAVKLAAFSIQRRASLTVLPGAAAPRKELELLVLNFIGK